jgi:DNA invertase Pin-like site-specific DNA recombinase
MSRQPVAYLRKSRVTNDRSLSWEVQEGKIRELADQHGENGNLLLLSDWNKSGGKGRGGRPGYNQLLTMVEADQVSAIYAYSLSRLSRSISDWADLAVLCVKHKIPVRLVADQNPELTTASGRLVTNILIDVAQMERELASERSKDTVAVRRARGDKIGHRFFGELPGEELAAVLQGYTDAGSVSGAVRLLNERGVSTRSGKPWTINALRGILARHRALPLRKRPGAKNAAPFVLFHLLRCACGRTMTAARYARGSAVYRCPAGYSIPHAQGAVSEGRIINWVKQEAARFRVPFAQVEIAERDESRRLELEARRQRVIDNYEDGVYGERGKAERDAKLLKIGDELANLEAADRVLEVPPAIDWTWEPKAINGVLRAVWDHIQLDAQMQPVKAEWRVPEWRS